jgi:hypothetical protein
MIKYKRDEEIYHNFIKIVSINKDLKQMDMADDYPDLKANTSCFTLPKN